MKAIRITEPGSVEMVDLPEPSPGPGEVLLKINAVGLCGSDLATYRGANPLVTYPRVPGHEISATVAAVTEGVPSSISPASCVTVVPYTSCGECISCRRGRSNACQKNQTLGVQRDGAMCEYLAVPWRAICTAPSVTSRTLALVEPLSVGFHAVDRACVTDIDTVAVVGCGVVGLGAVARAATRGARVIAVDVDERKLELAGAFGAARTINASRFDISEQLQAMTGKRGPEVIIEASGAAGASRSAVLDVSFAGRIVNVGYIATETPLATRLIVQKELDIRGSRNATLLDFMAAAAFCSSVACPVERVITREVSLSAAGRTFAEWAGNPAAVTKLLVNLESCRP